jgi:hypothetical protein
MGEAFGREIAAPSVAIDGDLGAEKQRSFRQSAGVRRGRDVTSPTFALVHGTDRHADVYHLDPIGCATPMTHEHRWTNRERRGGGARRLAQRGRAAPAERRASAGPCRQPARSPHTFRELTDADPGTRRIHLSWHGRDHTGGAVIGEATTAMRGETEERLMPAVAP